MTVRRNNLEQKEPEGLGYRDYVRNARVLRALPKPPVPAELQDATFLEGIYERAATDDLGQVLAEALPARPAPETAEAAVPAAVYEEEARTRPELQAHLAASPAPGWLWRRVQEDLRRQLAGHRRQARMFRLKVAAAAAVLLIVGAGVTVNLRPVPAQDLAIEIQVRRLERPIGPTFHPTDRLREIAR